MNRQDIIYWIDELKKMEKNHLPELDHKDCGEIAELLYCLMKEVEHLKTISAFNSVQRQPGETFKNNEAIR